MFEGADKIVSDLPRFYVFSYFRLFERFSLFQLFSSTHLIEKPIFQIAENFFHYCGYRTMREHTGKGIELNRTLRCARMARQLQPEVTLKSMKSKG